MIFLRRSILALALLAVSLAVCNSQESSKDYLALGDKALSSENAKSAIDFYKKGMDAIKDEEDSIVTRISLNTNLGKAYSAIGNIKAKDYYGKAVEIAETIDDDDIALATKDKTSEALYGFAQFFHEEEDRRKAAEYYTRAAILEPGLWLAWARVGRVFQDVYDRLELAASAQRMTMEIMEEAVGGLGRDGNEEYTAKYEEAVEDLKQAEEEYFSINERAIRAFTRAYNALTNMKEEDIKDYPEDVNYMRSQIQLAIGRCAMKTIKRNCAGAFTDMTERLPCKDLAIAVYGNAVELDPNNTEAKHFHASLSEDPNYKTSDQGYIKGLFDDFAETYDELLVKSLRYDAHIQIRRGLDETLGGQGSVPTFSTVIDAGCGTGLAGEQFRNISSHLIGVDLSIGIIEKAKEVRPNLYDEIIVGDIGEVIRKKKPVSLVFAADSIIYIGDLAPLFDSVQEGLEDNGYFVYNLEKLEESADCTWKLHESQRFSHCKEYVVTTGQKYGLTVAHYEDSEGFRTEAGKRVPAHLFVMQKGSENGKDEL